MHTLMTVIRKRPEISTADFRRFMEFEYGPTYVELSQVRDYTQYFVDDVHADDAEEPIDAIVRISFESREAMAEALSTDAYREAHRMRQQYLRETSIGIHTGVLAREVTPLARNV